MFTNQKGHVLFLLAVTAFAWSGCKTSHSGNDSESRSSSKFSSQSASDNTHISCQGNFVRYLPVNDLGYVGTAWVNQSAGKKTAKLGGKSVDVPTLDIKLFDPKTREICKSDTMQLELAATPDLSNIRVSRGSLELFFAKNTLVNYGFVKSKVECKLAFELFGVQTTDYLDKKCKVLMDTEDRLWFGVTIAPDGFKSAPIDGVQFDRLQDVLDENQQPSLVEDGPLKPGQVNMMVDTEILDIMLQLDAKFQNTPEADRERNSCLRNGRATGWVDLQAHFYCILPYEPYRTCYSNELVKRTEGINQKDRAGQVLQLVSAFNGAFGACLAPGTPGDFSKAFGSEGPRIARAFKYANFVRQGVMDFNVTAENRLISDYYFKAKKGRSPRLFDPLNWVDRQGRHQDIRLIQAKVLQLSLQ